MKLPTNWSAIVASFGHLSHEFLSLKAKAQARDKHGRFIRMHSVVRWPDSAGKYHWGSVDGIGADGNIHVKSVHGGADSVHLPKDLEVVKALIPHSSSDVKDFTPALPASHVNNVKASLNHAGIAHDKVDPAAHLTPVADHEDAKDPWGEPLYVDTAGFKKVGGQSGSNQGGVFEGPDGTQYYVKKAQTEQHAANELLAARMYQEAGIKVPDVYLTEWSDGSPAIASKMIPGMTPLYPNGKTNADTLAQGRKGFTMDAWLANWDSIGLAYDNMMKDTQGNAVRVDTGGALLYRAQGSPKNGLFSDTVGEIKTLRDPGMNPQAAKIFGGLTDAQLKKDVQDTVDKVDLTKVDHLIDELPFSSPQTKQELKDRIAARKADLHQQFGIAPDEKPVDLSGPAGQHAIDSVKKHPGDSGDLMKAADDFLKNGPKAQIPQTPTEAEKLAPAPPAPGAWDTPLLTHEFDLTALKKGDVLKTKNGKTVKLTDPPGAWPQDPSKIQVSYKDVDTGFKGNHVTTKANADGFFIKPDPKVEPVPGHEADSMSSAELIAKLEELRAKAKLPADDHHAITLKAGKGGVLTAYDHLVEAQSTKKLNDLAKEAKPYADALWKLHKSDVPALEDPNAAKWESVGEPSTITVGSLSQDAWDKLRDQYVVNDPLTLKNNASLRSGAPTPVAKSWGTKMDKMVAQHQLNADTILHRGAVFSPEFMATLKPGAVLEDGGFQSTGDLGDATYYSKQRARLFPGGKIAIFTIHAHKGQTASDVGYGEIVLPRNSKLMVKSAVESDGSGGKIPGAVYITAELAPNGDLSKVAAHAPAPEEPKGQSTPDTVPTTISSLKPGDAFLSKSGVKYTVKEPFDPEAKSIKVTNENGVDLTVKATAETKLNAIPGAPAAPESPPATVPTLTVPAPSIMKGDLVQLDDGTIAQALENYGYITPFQGLTGPRAGKEIGAKWTSGKDVTLIHKDSEEGQHALAQAPKKNILEPPANVERPTTDLPALTFHEKSALEDYQTDEGYKAVNGYLRGDSEAATGFYDEGAVESITEELQSAIQKSSFTKPGIVFRGTTADVLPHDYKPGTVLSDSAFMSATADVKIAENFTPNGQKSLGVMIEIHVPAGAHALDADKTNNAVFEDEFIFPPNTQIQIKEVGVQSNGRKYIIADLLPKGPHSDAAHAEEAVGHDTGGTPGGSPSAHDLVPGGPEGGAPGAAGEGDVGAPGEVSGYQPGDQVTTDFGAKGTVTKVNAKTGMVLVKSNTGPASYWKKPDQLSKAEPGNPGSPAPVPADEFPAKIDKSDMTLKSFKDLAPNTVIYGLGGDKLGTLGEPTGEHNSFGAPIYQFKSAPGLPEKTTFTPTGQKYGVYTPASAEAPAPSVTPFNPYHLDYQATSVEDLKAGDWVKVKGHGDTSPQPHKLSQDYDGGIYLHFAHEPHEQVYYIQDGASTEIPAAHAPGTEGVNSSTADEPSSTALGMAAAHLDTVLNDSGIEDDLSGKTPDQLKSWIADYADNVSQGNIPGGGDIGDAVQALADELGVSMPESASAVPAHALFTDPSSLTLGDVIHWQGKDQKIMYIVHSGQSVGVELTATDGSGSTYQGITVGTSVPVVSKANVTAEPELEKTSVSEIKPGDKILYAKKEWTVNEVQPSGIGTTLVLEDKHGVEGSMEFGHDMMLPVTGKAAPTPESLQTPAEPTPAGIPTGTLVPGSDHVYVDAQGKQFVVTGNGHVLRVGDQVTSTKDGLTGTIVQLEKGPKYIKVKGPDGKIKGRQMDTLIPAEKTVEAPAPAPSPVDKPSGDAPVSVNGSELKAGDTLHFANGTTYGTLVSNKPGFGGTTEWAVKLPSGSTVKLNMTDHGQYSITKGEAPAPSVPADNGPGAEKNLVPGKWGANAHGFGAKNKSGEFKQFDGVADAMDWADSGASTDSAPGEAHSETKAPGLSTPISSSHGEDYENGSITAEEHKDAAGYLPGEKPDTVATPAENLDLYDQVVLPDGTLAEVESIQGDKVNFTKPDGSVTSGSIYNQFQKVVPSGAGSSPQPETPATGEVHGADLKPGDKLTSLDQIKKGMTFQVTATKNTYEIMSDPKVLPGGKVSVDLKNQAGVELHGHTFYSGLVPDWILASTPGNAPESDIYGGLQPGEKITPDKWVPGMILKGGVSGNFWKVESQPVLSGVKPDGTYAVTLTSLKTGNTDTKFIKPTGKYLVPTPNEVAAHSTPSAPGESHKSVTELKSGDQVVINGQPGTVHMSTKSNYPEQGAWYLASVMADGSVKSTFITDNGDGTATGTVSHQDTPVTVSWGAAAAAAAAQTQSPSGSKSVKDLKKGDPVVLDGKSGTITSNVESNYPEKGDWFLNIEFTDGIQDSGWFSDNGNGTATGDMGGYIATLTLPEAAPSATTPAPADGLTGTLVPGSTHVYKDAKGKYVITKHGYVLREGMQVVSSKDGHAGTIKLLELKAKYAKVKSPDGTIKGRQIDTLKPVDPSAEKVAPGTVPGTASTAPGIKPTDLKEGDHVFYAGKPGKVITVEQSVQSPDKQFVLFQADDKKGGLGDGDHYLHLPKNDITSFTKGPVSPAGTGAQVNPQHVKIGDTVTLPSGVTITVSKSEPTAGSSSSWFLYGKDSSGASHANHVPKTDLLTKGGSAAPSAPVTPSGATTDSGSSINAPGGLVPEVAAKGWIMGGTKTPPQFQPGDVVGKHKQLVESVEPHPTNEKKTQVKFADQSAPLTLHNTTHWEKWDETLPGVIGKKPANDFQPGDVVGLDQDSKKVVKSTSEWGDTPGHIEVLFQGGNTWTSIPEDQSWFQWPHGTPASEAFSAEPETPSAPSAPEAPAGPVEISHDPVPYSFDQGGHIQVPAGGSLYSPQWWSHGNPVMTDGWGHLNEVNPATGELTPSSTGAYYLKGVGPDQLLLENTNQADVTPNIDAALGDQKQILISELEKHLADPSAYHYYDDSKKSLLKLLNDPTGESLTQQEWQQLAGLNLGGYGFTTSVDQAKRNALNIELVKAQKKHAGTYPREWSTSYGSGQYFYDQNQRKALSALGLSSAAQDFVATKNVNPSHNPEASAEIHAAVSDPTNSQVIDDLFGKGTAAKIAQATQGDRFIPALSGPGSPYAKKAPDLPETHGKNGTSIFLGDNVVATDGQGGKVILVTADGKLRVRRSDGSTFTKLAKNFVPTSSPVSSSKPAVSATFTAKPRPAFQLPDWNAPSKTGVSSLPDALAKIKESPGAGNVGWSFATGGSQVEDLDVRVSRVLDPSGKELLEVKFKLTPKQGDQMFKRHAADESWDNKTIQIKARQVTSEGKLAQLTGTHAYSGNGGRTFVKKFGDVEINFHRANNKTMSMHGSNPVAFHNTVQIYMPADSTQADISKALYDAGVDKPQPATAEDFHRLGENRLLALFGGKTNAWVGNDSVSGDQRATLLADIKSMWGVEAKDLGITQGANGRVELRLPQEVADKIRAKTKVNYTVHSLYGGTDALKELAKGPHQALLSTTVRRTEGVKANGMSSNPDIHSGGADYLFAHPRQTLAPLQGLVFDTSRLFQRMDWFTRSGDTYGTHSPNMNVIQETNPSAHEIMFKHRLSMDDAIGYVTHSSSERNSLISDFKAAGITKIGSRTLDEFFIINPGINATSTAPQVTVTTISSLLGGTQ